MKMTKRLLSALLALCMVMAMAPVTLVSSVAEGDTPISAGTTTVQLGEATEVTVTFVANGSAEEDDEYLVKYDTGVFSYSEEDCTDADVFELSKGSKKQNYAVVVDCYETGDYKNTTIGTVTFEIADDAAPGSYALTVDGETVGTIVLTPAFAPTEMTFRITSDKTELEPGDTFTVTYKIYSVPATGLTEYQFFNIFDENVFEFVSAKVPGTFGEHTNYGTVNLSQYMLCGTISPNMFTENSVLGTATFKVKDNAPGGSYVIDIDRTEQDPADPAWQAHPTSFSYYADGEGHAYAVPAVETLTVTVKGEVPPPEPTTYTVAWVVNGETVATETFKEGEAEPTYAGAEPTKAEDEKYTYAFTGWAKDTDAEGNITYTAQFEATLKPAKTYTVTWIVEGTAVLTSTYEEGEDEPAYTGAEPTKAEDEVNTYEFEGWAKDTDAEGNTTYTAQFKATAKPIPATITVTWVIEGAVAQTSTYKEGEAEPTYAGDVPTKPATAQYTYLFDGWNKTVEGDAVTYTAVFTETVNTYTVIFVDGDNVLATLTYPYGATIDYTAPEKQPTAEYTYSFEKFEPALAEVTGDATYQVIYTATLIPVEPSTYTVTWVVEGQVVATATYKEGEEEPAYAGATPTKAEDDTNTYEFVEWTKAVDEAGNTTYTAQFKAIEKIVYYTITFMDGDTVLATQSYAKGATIDYTAPTKPATDEYTYTFEKFEPALAEVTGDATYQVIYTATPVTVDPVIVSVTWVVEGTVVGTDSVVEGTEPEYTGTTPTKEADADNTYTFAGWEKTTDEAGNITYTAKFDATEKTVYYTITFMEGDVVLATLIYPAGATIDYTAPEKQPTAEYTYTFEKFEPALAVVTGDATYQVVYTAAPVVVEPEEATITVTATVAQLGETTEVTVTVVANGHFEEDDEILVKYDTAALAYASEEITNSDIFELAKGSKKQDYAVVVSCYETGDYSDYVIGTVTFEIAADAVAGSYALTVDGETVGTVELAPAFVVDEMTFRITSDKATLKPGDTFTVTYKIYGIPATGLSEYQFYNVFDPAVFEFVSASVPATIEGLTNYGTVNMTDYMLCGTVSPSSFTADVVLGTATFQVKENAPAGSYVIDIERTEQNPEDPAWQAHPTTFGYYDAATEKCVGYKVPAVEALTVEVEGEVKTVYTVTWVVEGTTVATATFEEGTEEPTYAGAEPTKAEDATYTYTFAGWDKTTDAEGNITYTAIFTPELKPSTTVTVTWVSEGTVLGTATYTVGEEEPTYAGPVPSKAEDDSFTYTFTGWSAPEIDEAGNITYTAQFSTTPKPGQTITVTWVVEGTTVATTTVNAGDVIPAYTGETPTKAEDAEYTYTFSEWVETTDAEGNITYTAKFTENRKPTPAVTLTVTWVVNGQTITVTFTAGEQVPAYTGETPTKDEDEKNTYVFDGWEESVDAEGNITYTPKFKAVPKKDVEDPATYTVTWIVDGKTVATATYKEGEEVPAYTGKTPTKPADSENTYVFDKWEAKTDADGNITYTAVFTATPKMGDVYFTMLWVVMMISCAAVVAVTFVAKKKIRD